MNIYDLDISWQNSFIAGRYIGTRNNNFVGQMSPHSEIMYALASSSVGTSNSGVSNVVIYAPIFIEKKMTFVQAVVRVGAITSATNIDMGLYAVSSNAKIFSTGSNELTTTPFTLINISPQTIERGNYYLAYVVDSTNTKLGKSGAVHSMGYALLHGMRCQSSTFPLPATATFDANNAAMAGNQILAGGFSTVSLT